MNKEEQIKEIKQTMVRSCNINRLYFEQMAEDLYNAGYGDTKQAVKEFAKRVKMAFYYEFDELIPSIMSDKIDELVKEVCGD